MKKALSIALSFIMVLSSITCLFISTASATETQSDWISGNAAYLTITDVTNTAGVTAPAGTDGEVNSLVATMHTTAYKEVYGLNPNSTYKVTAYVYKVSGDIRFAWSPSDTTETPYTLWAVPLAAGYGSKLWNFYKAPTGYSNLITTDFGNHDNGNPRLGVRADLSVGSWVEHTFEFNTTAATDYILAYGFQNSGTVYITNPMLEEQLTTYTMTATAEGNGKATVSAESAQLGTNVTFTATAYAEDSFIGWYNGNVLVSEDATYTVSASANLALTAKFTGVYVDWYPSLGIHNADYARTELSADADYTNGPGWSAPANIVGNSIASVVTLEPETDYTLTMWLKGDAEVSSVATETWVVDARAEFATASGNRYRHWSGAYTPVNAEYGTNLITTFPSDPANSNDGTSWRKVTIEFTTVAGVTEYIIATKFVNGSTVQYFSDTTIAVEAETCTMSATAEGNGKATVSAESAEPGTSVTFTATAYGQDFFLGWYDEDEQVSTNEVYTVSASANLALTAKFTGVYVDWYPSLGIHNADYARTELSEDQDYENGPGWSAPANIVGNSIAAVVTLEPETDYTLTMYLKGDAEMCGSATEVWVVDARAEFPTASGGRYRHWSGAYTPVNAEYGTNLITTLPSDLAADNEVTSWREVSFEFTTVADVTEYIIAAKITNGSSVQYFSDTSISSDNTLYTMSATADGGGKATVSAERVLSGGEVTFTATPYSGCTFDGWYTSNGDFVSAKAIYTVTATKSLNLTARFSGEYVDWMSSVGHGSDPYAVRTRLSEEDEYANGPGWSYTNTGGNSIYNEISLKPGTSYRLTMYVKYSAVIDNAYGVFVVPAAAGYSAVNGGSGPSSSTGNWSGAYAIPSGYSNLVTNAPSDAVTSSEEWRQYTFDFTTNEYQDYIIAVKFNSGSGLLYVSDTEIAEVTVGNAPEGNTFISHPGIALRKEDESANGQALRFKFAIDKEIINNAQSDGYELVEYGAVVTLASALSGIAADPVIGASAYVTDKAVAYAKTFGSADATKNVMFGENDDEVIYSVALYNIASAHYSAEFSVRPYALFSNGTQTYVRYGNTRAACVFDLAFNILNAADPDEDDIYYVNSILLPADSESREDYEAWLSEQN